jgi:threonine synthase
VSAYTGQLACLRCGDEHPEADAFSGCPRCAADGVPVNLAPVYDIAPGPLPVDPGQPGLFRYRELLPLADSDPVVSLGEGDSPLLPLHRIGGQLGLDGLWVKDESRSPTWSYKDRLAAVAVSKARASGADTAVVSTTGNHGAAVAAYCAAAGIRCVALTLTSVPATMRTLMQVYGAQVVAYREPVHRWTVMAAAVAERGWVPMSGFVSPPIGSNPFGIDGYKTIAYEIVGQLGTAPDVVVVPTAYADGLSGITRGFADLHRLGIIAHSPRMVAAEPFGPYGAALADGGDVAGPVPVRPSVAFSIATPVGTYQGLDAVRSTGGAAVTTGDDDAIMAMQTRLARIEGLYLEASSVVPLLAAERLRGTGAVRDGETVVVIGTSTGLKDVGATAARLPEPPVAEPSLADLHRALDQALDQVTDSGTTGLVPQR